MRKRVAVILAVLVAGTLVAATIAIASGTRAPTPNTGAPPLPAPGW